MEGLSHRIVRLSPEKRKLLLKKLGPKAALVRDREPIPPRPDSGPAPLTIGQYQIWLSHQLQPGTVAFNLLFAFDVRGALDREVLERTINYIIARHEVLRTTIEVRDGEPVQVVHPTRSLELPLTDLSELPEKEQRARLAALVAEEGRTPYDLAKGPLLRPRLVRLGESHCVFLLPIHHTAFDGWSSLVFRIELAVVYHWLSENSAPPLPELPIQNADLAHWQRIWFDADQTADQLAYWREKLGGTLENTELPTDRPRPPVRTDRGALLVANIPDGVRDRLRALCKRLGVTMFVALLAGFKALLKRYTGQDDIIVGSPFGARTREETRPLIGYFTNMLALRTDLSGDPGFDELVERAKRTCGEAFGHADVPFNSLVESLNPPRDPSRNPLFQLMFQLLEEPMPPESVGTTHVAIEPIDCDPKNVWADLEVMMFDSYRGLYYTVRYNTDLFDTETVKRLTQHFRALLEAATKDPKRPISQLPLLSPQERAQIAAYSSGPSAPHPEETTIDRLFRGRSSEHADRVALTDGAKRITYGALERRSNQLAHTLAAMGVGGGDAVGLLVSPDGERSLDAVVTLLGVLKAGSAYVPLDGSFPEERLRSMCRIAGVKLILALDVGVESFPSLSTNGVNVVRLDRDRRAKEAQSETPPAIEVRPDHLAYVLFTSGSTGEPKGVGMPHRALVNLIAWQVRASQCGAETRTMQLAPLGFDVHFQEIFSTWCAGGTLVLPPHRDRRDLARLLRRLERHEVHRIFLPFVALDGLAEVADTVSVYPKSLREVITAGEQLRITPAIRAFFQRLDGCKLINQYGPTEAHVVSYEALAGPPAEWPLLPPIGRPIDNAKLYLLDAHLQPVPLGVGGELCIAGDPVARGYVGRSDLTDERFLPDPFDESGGGRMYRTGDKCRFRSDGRIEFLGRLDRQVKVRGFRIEPAEVEAALSGHEAVERCAVIASGQSANRQLIAYITCTEEAPEEVDLRGYLATRLPEYMVPAVVVRLEEMPMTPSGKIDRLRLPAPGRPDRSTAYVPPSNALQYQLVKLWEEVLDVAPIGVHDDFFALGGHSLLAVRLFAQLEKRLGREIPLTTLFETPTVLGLSERICIGDIQPARIAVLQGEGKEAPLFCAAGFGGYPFRAKTLAQEIGPEQPFLGLFFPGAHGLRPPADRVEEIASALLEDVRSAQPEGPYYLSGYSFGGMVAYEMARQLEADRADVGLLVLWDPTRLTTFRTIGVLRHFDRVYVFFRWNLPKWLLGAPRWLWRQRQRIWRWIRHPIASLRARRKAPVQRTAWRLRNAGQRARRCYDPKPYRGQVRLLHTAAGVEGEHWRWVERLADHVDVSEVPGDHISVMRKPAVEVLAEEIREALRTARGGRTRDSGNH